MENKPVLRTCGMSLIVKTITRLTVGLILIYGIYVIFEGHKGPGGGFAGGVIIALSFIHLMLAFGKDAVVTKLNEKRGVALASLAACVLLLAAVYNCMGLGHRAEIYFVSEAASSVLVGAGFFVVFLVLITVTGKKESST